jgi:N-acetylneuraminic acid mutarotase
MPKLYSVIIFLFSLLGTTSSFAQNWVWVNGSNALDDQANYGTIGVETSTNKPGSRREFVTWKDATGNMYMFGGYGRTIGTTVGHLNDLWRYNPTNNQWTWLSGSNVRNQVGVYGTQNVPDALNKPGGRRWSTGWADNAGNLWLFGGFGYSASGPAGRLNDLWKYNIASGQWTWVSGATAINQVGDYTTLGALRPGARARATSWSNGTDAWLFAGEGYSSTFLGQLNDLWHFNSTTNTWTFIKGDNAVGVGGVYGTLGTSNIANKPGAREYATGWYHAGALYLFGGGTGTTQLYNDMWRYDLTTNEWTWLKGSNLANESGVYGTMMVADPLNNPGARQLASGVSDNNGTFFLVAGYGYSSSVAGNLNDVWMYRVTDNTWKWIKGSSYADAAGAYGTQNVVSSANNIGARYGAGVWLNASNNMVLFGGFGQTTTATQGYTNDVWTFGSGVLLPIELKEFKAVDLGADISLRWTTTSEINNDHFEIFHSANGQDFTLLSTVGSKGNSQIEQSYVCLHVNPNRNTTNYYRLKQVDIDGKESWSNTISVIGKGDAVSFNAHVTDSKQLYVFSNHSEYTLELYNAYGQRIREFSKGPQDQGLWDLGDLPTGVYIIRQEKGRSSQAMQILIP